MPTRTDSNTSIARSSYEEVLRVLSNLKDNVDDVRERLIRIEAQDHPKGIGEKKKKIDKQSEEFRKLELAVAEMKTKIAPLLVLASSVITTIIGLFLVR